MALAKFIAIQLLKIARKRHLWKCIKIRTQKNLTSLRNKINIAAIKGISKLSQQGINKKVLKRLINDKEIDIDFIQIKKPLYR